MKVGDLVKLRPVIAKHAPKDIGIIIRVWNDLDVDVLFHDGEFSMFTKDLEVISESR